MHCYFLPVDDEKQNRTNDIKLHVISKIPRPSKTLKNRIRIRTVKETEQRLAKTMLSMGNFLHNVFERMIVR